MQYCHVAVDHAGCKTQIGSQRNRNNEEVDQNKVERKHPCDTLDVGFLMIFNDCHIELPRQEQDDQQGEQCHRQKIGNAAAAIHERHDVRSCRNLRENIADAIEHHIRDKKSGNQKGSELNCRFHANGKHEPVMVLAGIDMAGTKGGCEGGEDQSDKQSEIAERRAGSVDRAWIMGFKNCFDRRRNRFELQRNVGNRSDHGDDRDECSHPLAFAVTRANKISDGCNVLGLGEPGNPADQRRAKPDQQDGPDINGKKIIPGDGS